jgi:uncharacterized membrane protein YbhN (UPF0104 family)
MEVWRVVIKAQAGGILLPGGIGGDALRIASVASMPAREGQARAGTAIVIASVMLDRAIGLTTLAAVAAGVGFAFGGAQAGTTVVFLACIPLAFVVGLMLLRTGTLGKVRLLFEGRLGNLTRPVLEYVRDPHAPRAIAMGLALSLVVSVAQLGIIRGFVTALGASPDAERWVWVGAAMALIVAAIPALPGGWGTADAAYVFFLGLAGLSAGVSLAACLLYRLFWYLSGVAGALLHLCGSRPQPARASAPPE